MQACQEQVRPTGDRESDGFVAYSWSFVAGGFVNPEPPRVFPYARSAGARRDSAQAPEGGYDTGSN